MPSLPRKYFWATMLVAFCDQVVGNSTPRCSKAGLSGSPMMASRSSHSTSSKGWTPGVVKRRSTVSPAWRFCTSFAAVLLIKSSWWRRLGVNRESLRATRTEPPSVERRKSPARAREGPGELQVGARVELAQAVQTELADPLRRQLAAAVVTAADSIRSTRRSTSAERNRSLVSRVQQGARELVRSNGCRLPFRFLTNSGSRHGAHRSSSAGRSRSTPAPAHRRAALGVAALEDPGWRAQLGHVT